jgi:hypothetical protein
MNTQRRNGHSKARDVKAMCLDIDETRFRVGHLMTFLGISHSTFYARLNKGLIPPPDGYQTKAPFWRAGTVRMLLADIAASGESEALVSQ